MRGLLQKWLRVHPGCRAGAGRKLGLNGVFVQGGLLPRPEAQRGGAAACGAILRGFSLPYNFPSCAGRWVDFQALLHIPSPWLSWPQAGRESSVGPG